MSVTLIYSILSTAAISSLAFSRQVGRFKKHLEILGNGLILLLALFSFFAEAIFKSEVTTASLMTQNAGLLVFYAYMALAAIRAV